MALIHLIAIFTGARIQTILTLRKSNFPKTIVSSSTDFKLKVGPGTGVDTKGDKIIFLYFPAWLCERICTYATSPRADNRQTGAIDGEHKDHLFLSKYGRPYYDTKQSTQEFNPKKATRYNSNGQEVRKFKAGLIKKIHQTDGEMSFHYRFHDLRATFGMNLTDAQLKLVREGNITLAQAREYVRFRMGHSSYETTDRYLNYRKNLEFVHAIRDSYGAYLHELRDLTLGVAV
jgi:integrase